MNWKLLFLGIAVGFLVVIATVFVGGWLVVTDDSPLLFYDSRPATVEEPAVSEAGYTSLNTTSFNASYSPVPGVGRNVSLRVWVSTYVTGLSTENQTAGPPSETPTSGNATVDVANTSVVTVVSMSSLELGPVAFNPLVYGSDPRVLNQSGFFIDQGEAYLPSNVTNVTDLTVRSDSPVRMVGQDTQMSRLGGSVVASPEADPVNVTVYVARVIHEGDLVMLVGVTPASGDASEEFGGLAEHVRHWEPDAGTPPTPSGVGQQSERTTSDTNTTERAYHRGVSR
ncbi:DUF6517 family protein [Haloarcula halophila]|uniref:DUF6517 family protein n=1 Tax=Haloarcula TaxID=2237 RepID=UPI0023E44205|nr:DUF6517 family protein [Halomicroarcula sp. DFY41]